MAKNRDKLLAKNDSIQAHLSSIEAYLYDMHSIYYPDYPKHFKPLEMAELMVSELITFFREFKDTQ